MFFSRECKALANHVPARLLKRMKRFACENVVGHVTFASPMLVNRRTLYGVCRPSKTAHSKRLAPHVIVKNGNPCMHHRVNTTPKKLNRGKFLVFSSANMIRAGKHTHADAMKNMFDFAVWAMNTEQTPSWHAAMSAPNMVVSGKFHGPLPAHAVDHWRCTHTSKFPGIAVSTDGACTPELYKSGAFIIPGVTTLTSLVSALVAIDEVLHDLPLSHRGEQDGPGGQPTVPSGLGAAHAVPADANHGTTGVSAPPKKATAEPTGHTTELPRT